MEGDGSGAWLELHRRRTAILVADVVESVRLMQANEPDVIRRWRQFVTEVRGVILPRYGGRLVKSLGDGMLLSFEAAGAAVQVATEMMRCIETQNIGRLCDEFLQLRIGVHVADVVVDELDIFGSGVNLTARLAGLAHPAEIVISAEASDELAPLPGVFLEDMGPCYLKHLDEPVRCFRVRTASTAHPLPSAPTAAYDALQPVVAVVPLMPRDPIDPRQAALGDALADVFISALSHRRGWRVISRLSTARFARGNGNVSLDTLRASLGAVFVVSGNCSIEGGRARVHIELSDTRNRTVLLADDADLSLADFFAGQDARMDDLLRRVSLTIDDAEVRRARSLPLQTLESYTLYVGGTKLLHRLGRGDFDRSRELLTQVHERVPRASAPLAMLAKWHVLRITQGWTLDAVAEGEAARVCAQRALQLEPEHAFALTVDGLAALQSRGDLDTARLRYEAALASDAQEPYAWATQAGLLAYTDRPEEAIAAARRAIELSPLDPQRFMFDAYLAVALLVAGRHAEAIAAVRDSLRLNRSLSGGYRILAVAHALAGEMEAARAAVASLLALEPRQTLADFARRYPGRNSQHMAEHLRAMRVAGVPP